MMLRLLVVGVLLVVAATVQTAVLPLMSIGGFRPDLVMLLVIAFAVDDGPEVGVRVGFVAGFLTDLLLATSALGVASLTYACVGYGVGAARPYLAPTSATAPLLLGFTGSVVGAISLGVLSSVLGDTSGSPQLLVTAALVVGVTHTLLMPAALLLTRGVGARFPAQGTPVR